MPHITPPPHQNARQSCRLPRPWNWRRNGVRHWCLPVLAGTRDCSAHPAAQTTAQVTEAGVLERRLVDRAACPLVANGLTLIASVRHRTPDGMSRCPEMNYNRLIRSQNRLSITRKYFEHLWEFASVTDCVCTMSGSRRNSGRARRRRQAAQCQVAGPGI